MENFQPGTLEHDEASINELDKLKLNTKKATHKMKKVTKLTSGAVILIILILAAVGTALFIRDQRYKHYA